LRIKTYCFSNLLQNTLTGRLITKKTKLSNSLKYFQRFLNLALRIKRWSNSKSLILAYDLFQETRRIPWSKLKIFHYSKSHCLQFKMWWSWLKMFMKEIWAKKSRRESAKRWESMMRSFRFVMSWFRNMIIMMI